MTHLVVKSGKRFDENIGPLVTELVSAKGKNRETIQHNIYLAES